MDIFCNSNAQNPIIMVQSPWTILFFERVLNFPAHAITINHSSCSTNKSMIYSFNYLHAWGSDHQIKWTVP
jgi:uncharacterized protein (DUF486 family)